MIEVYIKDEDGNWQPLPYSFGTPEFDENNGWFEFILDEIT